MRLVSAMLVGLLGACTATEAERVEAPSPAPKSSERTERIELAFELARITREEDASAERLDEAVRSGAASRIDECRREYRETITRSDELARLVFTPEYVASRPWIDLLGPEQAPNWNAASLEGFAWRIEDGVLKLHGPDSGTQQCGVVSICDREQLRDFVLDFEFTLAQGEFELCSRVGLRFDGTVESLKFSTLEDSQDASFLLPRGETFGGTWSFIGSSWTGGLSAGDPQTLEQVKWSQSRKGGIGIIVPPATELTFTRLRVKSLRQSGPN
ncbi:MAG: hypothetical protein HZA52_02995 [Planctomycetes bacterium]|nr:hypothetical protein [Planctomycetota bacterium]